MNAENRWEAAFHFLPVVEEQKIDPASGAQTIYFYSYYIEETGCSPGDFYPVFRDSSSGAAVGDAGSPVDYSTQLTAENKQKTVSIKSVSSSTTWQLETPEDVQKYISALQAKLNGLLEEDTIINIEF